MTTTTQAPVTTQVHRVYIKATPEWTRRYGYGGDVEYDLRPGGAYRALASEEMRAHGAPEVAVDGEVIEADPPRRLVQTWRMMTGAAMAAEGFTRLTYEIEATADGVTKLTIVHDLTGAPGLAAVVAGDFENVGAGGGWSWVLSDMKSLIETGTRLAG